MRRDPTHFIVRGADLYPPGNVVDALRAAGVDILDETLGRVLLVSATEAELQSACSQFPGVSAFVERTFRLEDRRG